MKTTLGLALACCTSVACCTSMAFAQDAPRAATPVSAIVVADNAFVQVLRLSLPPHAQTPMHDITSRVVVWLRDAHYVDRYADGRIIEERRKAEDAEWVSARRHAGENLSDQPMEFIAVVLKGVTGGGDRGAEGAHN